MSGFSNFQDKLQKILDRAQYWALGGLVLLFLVLIGFAFLPQDINSVVIVPETKKTEPPPENDGRTLAISLEQKKDREPASMGGPELQLKVRAIADSVGPDFSKIDDQKKCVKDPTCQLDEKPLDIYVKIKDAKTAVPQEDYRSLVQKLIHFLLGKMERDSETKALYMEDAKMILRDHFQGQEDCWSCPGSDDFDRLEALIKASDSKPAGTEPVLRKPLGLEDLLEHGDDAYQNGQFDQARRFYSEVLQILDERDLTQSPGITDDETLSRIQNRCLELECRP